ncbi:MAG TPA: hypothetical protein VFP64_19850 [Pyrinomonadaceae bacterium]|nr:hypothetical protein [Pyrinomonadaceae bacterium]
MGHKAKEIFMSVERLLNNLQVRQREHDIKAHKDIYYLPNPERIKHLSFHIAKYAGRLAMPDECEENFTRTLVDTFIIALSASELLGISLPRAVGVPEDTSTPVELKDFGLALSTQLFNGTVSRDWYFRQLARVAGQMSKACESLDHLEDFPFREVITKAVIDLILITIATAAFLEIDLTSQVHARWNAIEAKQII